jgi:transketolase
MSAADLMAVLLTRHFRYDWQRPDDPANDHLIFSKGHASPLLYSMFKAAGVVSDDELMNGYRRFGSVLEGHPTPVLPWVDVATGSLGCPTGSAWPWPAATSTSSLTASGCSAATARWPRDRYGRRWTRPPTTG